MEGVDKETIDIWSDKKAVPPDGFMEEFLCSATIAFNQLNAPHKSKTYPIIGNGGVYLEVNF